jgi:hypothetical protein
LAAYGGADLWLKSRRLRAVVSASGWAFTLKRRPAFERAEFECDIARAHCRLTPIGRQAQVSGVLRDQDVELQDASGQALAQRRDARRFFPFGRRTIWWDDLDMSWFACYAFWNYLTLPRLLLNPEVGWSETAPGQLRAEFPAHIPTHSRHQRFDFDPASGLLRRHDYCADVVAPIAHAANVVLRHECQNGLTFAAHRRVTPISPWRRALPAPVLVDIQVHELVLEG